MTLTATTSRVEYPGAGTTGPFAFPFKVSTLADLSVVQRGSDGTETSPTFTATGLGNSAGGSVTLTTALPVGDTLVIRRSVSATQPTDIRNQGTYFPDTIEDAFDRLAMIDQTQQDAIERSFRLRPAFSPSDYTLEVGAPEVGKVLTGTGSGVEWTALDGSAVSIPGNGRTVSTLSAYFAHNAVFCPLDFGAAGDGGSDDAAAVQATLAAARAFADTPSSWGIPVVDLRGRVYRLDTGVQIPGGRGLVIGNGRLVAGPAFSSSDYLLTCGASSDTTLADGFKINNLTLTDLYLDCQHKGGGFLCQRYNRVRVDRCIVDGYVTQGIKTAVDGHELLITNSWVGEYFWGDTSSTGYNHPESFVGTGIDLNTSDNHVTNCVVQLCKIGIRNAKQANSFDQVHIWPGYVKVGSGAGTTMTTMNTAVYQTAAGLFSTYDQCYIDGGTVILEDPWETSITNGFFLHGGGDPSRSWIILKPLATGRSIRGLVITGNKFKTNGGGLLKALSVDTSVGSFSASIKGCRFDNTFAPGVTRFDSRYTDRVSQVGASTWTWDLSAYFPVGVVQIVEYAVYQYGGTTASFRLTNVTGNTITVGSFDPAALSTPLAVNASVYLVADINIPIPEEAP